jgi:hypothetical protein
MYEVMHAGAFTNVPCAVIVYNELIDDKAELCRKIEEAGRVSVVNKHCVSGKKT